MPYRNQVARTAAYAHREAFTADATTLPYTITALGGIVGGSKITRRLLGVVQLANGSVGLPAAAATGRVVGQLELVEADQKCTVLVGPNLLLSYFDTASATTNTIVLGDAIVIDQYGLAKTSATGEGKVVMIDTTAKTVEVLFN